MRRRTLIRDAETALEFAVDAYVYLYPLVLLDLTRRQATSVTRSGDAPGRAPVNEFAHVTAPLSAGFRDVVRPTFDTLQSFAWLNVAREPVIVSVPDAGDGYYVLPMLDMWSDLVAAPGTRTAGNWPAEYAVVGRRWEGELPERVRRIDTPTPYVWLVGRTAPVAGAEKFQPRLAITPLSRWERSRHRHLRLNLARRRPDPAVDPVTPPVDQVDAMTAPEFFTRAADVLGLAEPHVHDHSVLQRIERIGLVPGEPFKLRHLPRVVADVLPTAAARARFELFRRSRRLGRACNGWLLCSGSLGAWGTDYLKRAAVARTFLGAGLPEDIVPAAAFVDGSGRPLDGRHGYTLRFPAHEEPPARALWSLTVYDSRGYAVPNAIDRYALGSADDLERSADGAVEIALRHGPPSGTPASNWLPCPAGPFNLCLRLYCPDREALESGWAPPPVERDDPARTRASLRARAAR